MPIIIKKRSNLVCNLARRIALTYNITTDMNHSNALHRSSNHTALKAKHRNYSSPKGGVTDTGFRPLEKRLPRANTAKVSSTEDTDSNYYSPYKCLDCKDTKRVVVYDVCYSCDGVGCSKCNNKGDMKNYIPCQTCTTKFRY